MRIYASCKGSFKGLRSPPQRSNLSPAPDELFNRSGVSLILIVNLNAIR